MHFQVKSYIFQTYESMCSPLESGDLHPVVVNIEASLDPVRDAILDLRERVEDLCNQELGKITKQGLLLKYFHVYVPSFFYISSSHFRCFFQSMTQHCSL